MADRHAPHWAPLILDSIPLGAPTPVLLACAASMAVLLGMTGCGGSDSGTPDSTAQVTGAGTDQPSGAQPQQGQEQPGQTPDAGQPGQQPDAGQPDAKPKDEGDKPKDEGEQPKDEGKKKPDPDAPKRPVDVSKWRVEDYDSAKIDGDPHLAEAARYLAERFHGDESNADKAARLLMKMLRIDPAPTVDNPPEGARQPQPIMVANNVALAIVDSLGKLRCPEGAAGLRDLMAGKMQTPIDGRNLQQAVLAALANNSDYKPHEDILFAALTDPNKVRAKESDGGAADVSGVKLQQEIVMALDKAATEGMRNRMAKYLYDPQVPQETAAAIEQLIGRDRPENHSSLLLLFQSPHLEKRMQQKLEASLSMHAARALEVLMGIPAKLELPPPPGTLTRPSLKVREEDPQEREVYLKFASMLWNDKITDFLTGVLNDAGEPENAPGVMVMLASTPTAAARFTMSEVLSYHAPNGPRAWTSAGLNGRSTSDPGFLVQSKLIYLGSTRRPTVIKDDRPRVDQEAKDQWAATTEQLVENWFQRFYTAARQPNPPSSDQYEDRRGKMPVVLHPNANIVAEYHLLWPDDAREVLPGVQLAPTEVHYVRVEEDALPDRLFSRYKRYGGRGKIHDTRKGHWIEGLINGGAPFTKVSIDIRITSTEQTGETLSTKSADAKPVPTVVEILTIEIPEPAEQDKKPAS